MDLPEGVTFASSFTCWTCGHTVKTKPGGVRPKHHGCRLRWIGRTRRKAYLDGWHSGYRWAVENPDDPMCLADADDYGTGWAAVYRSGGIEITTAQEGAE